LAISQTSCKFILNDIKISELENNINEEINNSIFSLCETIFNEVKDTALYEIIELVKSQSINEINSANIPQFSSFANGTISLIEKLRMAGNYGPTFSDLGEQLLGPGKKKGAYIKYGENHAKLAQLYDLVYITKNGVSRVYLTSFGRIIEKLDITEQKELLIKLSFKIPIIQKCKKDDIQDAYKVEELLKEYLSETTALRRKSNVLNILKNIEINIGKEERYEP